MKVVNDEHLDAICISNELRFPNHSGDKPNCEAKSISEMYLPFLGLPSDALLTVKLVNDQYKIGIYATGVWICGSTRLIFI